jgi:hypothetical protein
VLDYAALAIVEQPSAVFGDEPEELNRARGGGSLVDADRQGALQRDTNFRSAGVRDCLPESVLGLL